MRVDISIRNARFTEDGRIDCEIQHPVFGWVPFTASPDDPEEHGRAIFASLRDTAIKYSAPEKGVPE